MGLPAPATDGKGIGNLPCDPFPLGKTTVTTAGVAVKLTGNFTDIDNRQMRWMSIRALDTNQGTIYIIVQGTPPPWTLAGGGGTTSGADTTNFLNVVQWLSAGETWNIPTFMMNLGLRMGQFYVDGNTNGDGVIASAFEA